MENKLKVSGQICQLNMTSVIGAAITEVNVRSVLSKNKLTNTAKYLEWLLE